jgi:tripartite-type tricarboxylate transporter receptor subunit TctC
MRFRRPRIIAGALAGVLATLAASAACQAGSRSGGLAEADCSGFPSKDIRLLVPYSAGGGFDAWARLMSPYIGKKLGGGARVTVENMPGGGGMRAANELYTADPDGTTLVFTEPGYIATNQVLGRAPKGFDLRKLTYLGQATSDPQVFAVAAKSGIRGVQDLARRPIKHAAQDISPIETITYGTYGVRADYILHEGTSEVVLAVRRGDADVTVASLSSILEFLRAGELRPVLFIGTEKITPSLLGYEQLKDVPTAAETGHPELAGVLEQHRVLAAPPKLPGCVKDKLSTALSQTLADPAFASAAQKAGLRIVPAGAAQAQARVTATLAAFEKYRGVLQKEIAE